MFKNIINLTKILSKNLLAKLDFIDADNKRFNTKSFTFWLLLIVVIAISFISLKIVFYLRDIYQTPIFLDTYLMLMSIILVFQTILVSINNYYFSSELKSLLPLPIKPKELLIAKFLTIVFNIYISEIIFLVSPMIIYGVMTHAGLLFYMYLLVTLLIFPLLPVLIISIVMSILIKLSKFIKNKNFFQIIVIVLSIICMFSIESKIISSLVLEVDEEINTELVRDYIINFDNRLKNSNKIFIQVNGFAELLTNQKILDIVILLKICLIDAILFIIFIFMEKKYYIKDILKNNDFYKKKQIITYSNIRKSKKSNKKIAYLKKEFKLLFRTPAFFVQGVFPTIILIFTIFLLTVNVVPSIREFLEWEMLEGRINLNYNLKMAGAILFLIQIILTFSNISITGISREGKKAKYMKELPMNLYDQFICKASVQIIINDILLILCIYFLHKVIPNIKYLDLFFLAIMTLLLNIINSKLMLLVDLMNPNINWDSEYEIFKNQKNKIFQYAFSIGMILLITYLVKILKESNIIMSYLIIIDIFMILIFSINLIVKLNIQRLFNKIDH